VDRDGPRCPLPASGRFPRITFVEGTAFVFSIFTLYGCGPTPVLYGLLLLLLGIPFYTWQRREHIGFDQMAADRVA